MRVVFKSYGLSLAVPFIIFINIFVYFMWWFSSEAPNSFMVKNFLVSSTALEQGRIWTVLTSSFSHNMFFHIFINMYVLSGFGKVVERVIGSRNFFKFYIYAGIVSGLAHCLTSTYFLNDSTIPALGASGSVAGIILLFSLMFPKEKVLLLGIIPMPAMFGAFLFMGLDIWGLTAQAGGHGLPIGHGAHLGGAFFGLLYYFLKVKPEQLKLKKVRDQQSNVIDVDYERIQ